MAAILFSDGPAAIWICDAAEGRAGLSSYRMGKRRFLAKKDDTST